VNVYELDTQKIEFIIAQIFQWLNNFVGVFA